MRHPVSLLRTQPGVAYHWRCGLVAVATCLAGVAHAQLFSDDEARRAILDLRQRIEANRLAADQSIQRQAEQQARAEAEVLQLRRALLDLQNQIDALKAELARARGREEQLARDLSEVQRAQRDTLAAVDERVRRFEPVKVSVDGKEFTADPAEKRDFEAALTVFRGGDMTAAQTSLNAFLRRWGAGGYVPSALYWLGNALYATRQYEPAIESFRKMMASAPDHPRAAEALLAVANCQVELKDPRAARKTYEDLVRLFPQTEAAATARERLSRMR